MAEEREEIAENWEKLKKIIPKEELVKAQGIINKMFSNEYGTFVHEVFTGIEGVSLDDEKGEIKAIQYRLSETSISNFVGIIDFLNSKKIPIPQAKYIKEDSGKHIILDLGEYGKIKAREDMIMVEVDNYPEKVKIVDEIREYLVKN